MSATTTDREGSTGHLAIIGVGLIGGSFGLAARQSAGARAVKGYDADPEALEEALRIGAITVACASPEEAAAGADVVLVSTPVRNIPEAVKRCAAAVPSPRAVTDTGSTKSAVMAALSPGTRRIFVGGHPICGAETAGVRFARADIFQGATYFLCPTQESAPDAFDLVNSLVAGVGARPVVIGPDAHDRIMALVSHVPHVLANVMMSEVGGFEAGGRRALFSVGPSFKELTRVAGANPRMWRDIFLENREALTSSLRSIARHLDEFCDDLDRDDEAGVLGAIYAASRYRKELLAYEDIHPDTLYRLTVRIPDEPGVLSRVMTALGNANINIEDLTMHHFNRDAGGDLVVYVSGEEAAFTGEALLRDLGYATVVSFTGGASD